MRLATLIDGRTVSTGTFAGEGAMSAPGIAQERQIASQTLGLGKREAVTRRSQRRSMREAAPSKELTVTHHPDDQPKYPVAESHERDRRVALARSRPLIHGGRIGKKTALAPGASACLRPSHL